MTVRALARSLVRAAVRAGAIAEPLLGGPLVHDGDRLDPELHVALAAAARAGMGRLHTMTPAAARAYAARAMAPLDAAPRAMARVIDTFAPGPAGPIPVRVYEPPDARPALLVWFHGGGGVIGGIADHDAALRLVAARSRCRVASVDYRLGPEHPHPAAIEDAVAAWRWACANAARLGADPGRVGVAGDSFGGFLSAWVERRAAAAADRAGEGTGGAAAPVSPGARSPMRPPAVVGLVYPGLDLTMSMRSIDALGEGFLLTRAMIEFFRGHYAPDPATRRPGSPLFVPDVSGAAPTLIVTAGFDPLRDEGRAWADRLVAAGARVTYRCEPDLVHGFLTMTGAFRRCDEAVGRLCEDFAAALGV